MDNINNRFGTIILNNKKYYYKYNDAYIEILVEKIEDLFNLNHAHYTPFTSKYDDYYLTEDLNNLGKFQTAAKLKIESESFYDVVQLTDNIFHDKQIIEDLHKMFFMDLMIMNIDRSPGNWGFVTKDNKTKLYLLDNDISFFDTLSYMTTFLHNFYQDSLDEIENIYNTFSYKYINLFNDMLNTLDCQTLERIIEETEEEIKTQLPYKQDHIKKYKEHREKIENIKNKSLILKK